MKAGEALPNTDEACRRDRRLEKADASKGLRGFGASGNNTAAAAAGACRANVIMSARKHTVLLPGGGVAG